MTSVVADATDAAHRAWKKTLTKVFPDHWSFLLGELAMFSFVVLVVTGLPLAFLYRAGSDTVVYDGSYEPMQGIEMSTSYASTLDISFDVPGGIVLRQVHHWAALLFIALIAVHAARVFFTAAYRHPRRRNWLIGVTLLLLAMANGQLGLGLPGDLQAMASMRITYSTVLSVPVAGPPLALLLFGGEFPASAMLGRLYWLHVLAIPVAITGLLAVHLALVFRHSHTQFAAAAPRPQTVTGLRLWPHHAIRAGTMFAVAAGTLLALGAAVQINPVWLTGPYEPASASVPAQPDWYLAWVEGILRLYSSMHVIILGYEIPGPFFGGVLAPTALIAGLYAWPYIETRRTHDREEHHFLERPRHAPSRTALGVGMVTLLVVLSAAGGHDVAARELGVPLESLTQIYRILVVVAPVTAAVLTYRICRHLDPPHMGPQR